MAYARARARKHYRVAQKEAEETKISGLFIPDCHKNKVIAMAIIFALVAFLKGFLFGYIAAKNEE